MRFGYDPLYANRVSSTIYRSRRLWWRQLGQLVSLPGSPEPTLGRALPSGDRGSELTGTHPVILPGVGAFGAMMQALDERGFTAPLQAIATANVPLLGICVGLQVLFDGSEEAPGVRGLGLIPGQVVKFAPAPGIKIPQIGWNRLRLLAERGSITTSPPKQLPHGRMGGTFIL
jgi:hypothetical protein